MRPEALKASVAVPETAFEAELMLGALLLCAERMSERELRRLLAAVRLNAQAQSDAWVADFMWAYADVLAKDMED